MPGTNALPRMRRVRSPAGAGGLGAVGVVRKSANGTSIAYSSGVVSASLHCTGVITVEPGLRIDTPTCVGATSTGCSTPG